MPQTDGKQAGHRRWLPVAIACALLIGAAMWAAALLPLAEAEEPAARQGDAVQNEPTGSDGGHYLLKAWGGTVALFDKNGTEPLTVYEVAVQSLPPEEQRRLQEGIAVGSDEELQEILENYTS